MLLVSQLTGLAVLLAVTAVRGEGPPRIGFLAIGALGGVAGIVGIAAFYRGLAVGAMGVVAPISATAAVVPLVVGVATGERPSAFQAAGIALALAGVVLASRESKEASAAGGRAAAGVGLALVAAAGFGTFFVLIDAASEADPVWAIVASRVTGLGLLLAAAAATGARAVPERAEVPALMAIGVFDLSGQTLFALASTVGLVSVVSVLASLYPVTTIVLARVVLGERVRALQRAGAAGALVGVALITAG